MARLAVRSVLVVVALAAFVALEAPPRSVLAHAEPERADPPIDGTVAAAPTTIVVWFTEEVDPDGTSLTVLGPDGAAVDLGDSTVDLNDPERKRVTVSLPPDLSAGVYTVQWSATSGEDEHAEDGEFTFTVTGGGASSPPSPAAGPAASPVTTPAASPTADTAIGTPEAETAATDDGGDFDEQAFAIAVGAGVAAAVVIYLFWRAVRPRRVP